MPSIFMACLLLLIRTSSAVLNRRGENRYPCLTPDLWGELSVFYHHCDVLWLTLKSKYYLNKFRDGDRTEM
jgi:hypothetical protein